MTFTPQKAIPQFNQDQTQDQNIRAQDPKHSCPIHLPFAPPPCIYVIYTPSLGLVIAVSVRGRGQGRSRGSRREQGRAGGRGGEDNRARGSISGQCRISHPSPALMPRALSQRKGRTWADWPSPALVAQEVLGLGIPFCRCHS